MSASLGPKMYKNGRGWRDGLFKEVLEQNVASGELIVKGMT